MPCLNYLSRDAIRGLYQEIHNFPALLVYHNSYLNDSYLPLVPGTIKFPIPKKHFMNLQESVTMKEANEGEQGKETGEKLNDS